MRSSIACNRCRKSKIKCENEGVNTNCKACLSSNKECTYPLPSSGSSSTPKRLGANGSALDFEGETKRPRGRPSEAGRKSSMKEERNALESPPISSKLWEDIHDTFQQHFAVELSFVQRTAFLEWATQPADERSPDTEEFLLGILTLAARYVPELVRYHTAANPGRQDYIASDFYAAALRSRVHGDALCRPSVKRCQALLMLGVYEWGMCRSNEGWMYTGLALSMAELLGLFFEIDNHGLASKAEAPPKLTPQEIERESRELNVRPKSVAVQQCKLDDQMRDRETRRRTMYSIFIMDKCLSAGAGRRQRIRSEELKVQLPCSDRNFRFGNDVKTGFLTDTGIKLIGPGSLDSSHTLAIYIRLMDIWGKLTLWACNGGRRIEKFPPWDKRSNFYHMRKELDDFDSSLPAELVYTQDLLKAHIDEKTSAAYTSIHTLYAMCRIVLHREHIPFIAISCEKPCGPLDPPTFPPDKYQIPEGFWEESARYIFKSARDIVEIVRSVAKNNRLVQSAIVGFAIWQAAFVGIYAINFPQMDQGEYMCDVKNGRKFDDSGREWKGATGIAINTLKAEQATLVMARGWFNKLRDQFHYFVGLKNSLEAGTSKGNGTKHSIREGGEGGGLEEYKLAERALKDFGTFEDGERYTPEDGKTGRSSSRAMQPNQPHSGNVKMEGTPMQGVERTSSRPDGLPGWAAVNNNNTFSNGLSETYNRPENDNYNQPNNLRVLSQAAESYGSNQAPPQTTAYYPSMNPHPNLLSPPNTSTPGTVGTGSPYAATHNNPEGTQNTYYNVTNPLYAGDPLQRFEAHMGWAGDVSCFSSGSNVNHFHPVSSATNSNWTGIDPLMESSWEAAHAAQFVNGVYHPAAASSSLQQQQQQQQERRVQSAQPQQQQQGFVSDG